MNNTRHIGRIVASALVTTLIGVAPALHAAPSETPCPYAKGEQSHGMRGGMGMGRGMMGGYGMDQNMMGSMGPGMLGGMGMMGGMGMGMMNPYWGSSLDLTDEQQSKLNNILDEARKKHWSQMGAMMDEQARLRDLYQAPERDDAAIDQTYKAIGKLQQEMFETSVESRKRMDAILTREQQEQLREFWQSGRMRKR